MSLEAPWKGQTRLGRALRMRQTRPLDARDVPVVPSGRAGRAFGGAGRAQKPINRSSSYH